ncbi:exodeoxyribonuclease III [Candidatus Latescibacterota bacterium]
MTYTILSWNVNGIRAVERKGFLDWLGRERPWLVAIQETKAAPGQLDESLRGPDGYRTYWDSSAQPGYSGVAAYCREKPLTFHRGLDIERFDSEGRTLILEFDHFFLFNIYFPNGKKDDERLAFKLDFYRAFFEVIKKYRKQKKTLLVCGDFNTAHREIDLARPKENSTVSGFLFEERKLIDEFIGMGFFDTFREFHPEGGRYSWWDYKSGARVRNVGWRIDYFFIDKDSKNHVTGAFIRDDVMGSDHCPVGVTLSY